MMVVIVCHKIYVCTISIWVVIIVIIIKILLCNKKILLFFLWVSSLLDFGTINLYETKLFALKVDVVFRLISLTHFGRSSFSFVEDSWRSSFLFQHLSELSRHEGNLIVCWFYRGFVWIRFSINFKDFGLSFLLN